MTISKTSFLAETLKRKTYKKEFNKVQLKGDFLEQDRFINDQSKYLAAQCSRRAGKSNALALKFFKTMEKHPKSQCLYLSLTQDSARSILWPILQEIDERYKIGCEFTESKLEVKHPNGSRLKLMGADLKNFIKRLRGRKYPAVAIDEVQDMGPHVQSLIDDVLTPSIADYEDSWLAITGTPGPVPHGYFFDVTNKGLYGYSVHKWTLLENIHMPKPQEFINDLKTKRGWNEENPTLQREWRNKWVLDVESLWVRYKENLNNYDSLPSSIKWNYIMGVDIGYNDADAIAVLAWSEQTPQTYLVDEIITPKQGLTDLISQIDACQKKYNTYKIVLDEGGLGKKIAEDIRSRFGCPLQPADKAQKQSNVEFLNDSLRLGNFKAKQNSRFAQDSYQIQIDWEKTTPGKIVIKKKPHSDIIDAVLYAFRESQAHTYQKPVAAPPYGSKAWAKQQEEDLWQAAVDHFDSVNNTDDEKEYNKWLIKGD